MSDVLVWIPGVFPDTRPLWPTQVSAVINLHRSKLPPIPNERKREVCGGAGGRQKEGKKETEDKGVWRRGRSNDWQGKQEVEEGERMDEDSDGS